MAIQENDTNRLCVGFKNIQIEQNEDHLDYIRKRDESIIEKLLKN